MSLPPPVPIHPGQGSKSLEAVALLAPFTFSHTTRRGRIILMASRMDTHRFDRVPSVMPRRAPARLTSWQGEPPEIMSTGDTFSQSTAVTSRKFGASGKCCARIFDGASSNSHTHAVVAFSARSTASASPPYPAKSSPAVSLDFGICLFLFEVMFCSYHVFPEFE